MARQNCKNWNEIAENSARFETYKIEFSKAKVEENPHSQQKI